VEHRGKDEKEAVYRPVTDDSSIPKFFTERNLAKFRSLRHLDLNIGPTTVGTAGEKVTAQE